MEAVPLRLQLIEKQLSTNLASAMAKNATRRRSSGKVTPIPESSFPKLHPWRLCPLEQHWVREHPRRLKPTAESALLRTTSVAGHCRRNSSHKDQLYPDEIHEIALLNFGKLRGAPKSDDLGFGEKGNQYDSLIRGWTRYWNEVFKPSPRLDPDLVKALIGSESSFKWKQTNDQTGPDLASGLMQVTNATVGYLKDEDGELKDHLINVDQEDVFDPNLNIAAGIRWLFQKRRLASSKLGREATWEEAVAEYKSYLKNYLKNPAYRGMGTFRKLHRRLKR